MARMTDSILAELDQEAATTLRVLERVPGDKLGWKPHPKSMSLGQLALHVATTPGGVASVLSQDSLESTGFDRPAPASAAELIPALEESVKAAKRFLSELNDQKAMAAWRLTKDGKVLFGAPRIAVIRSIMLNHWYHHRGQHSVYPRMLKVTVPSIYGPSTDENHFT